MSLIGISHPNVTRGSRLSRAPYHDTLPAFLNLHWVLRKKYAHLFWKLKIVQKVILV